MEQLTFETYRDRGFIVLSLLFDISTGEQAMAWAEANGGLTYPILIDDQGIGSRYEVDGGVPSFTLIGPGAEVIAVDGAISNLDIEAHLP